jgi:hypothetical protein
LYFKITEITFKYNIDLEFLDCSFFYTIMTPTWEEIEEKDFDWVWTCVA